jgi:hypothetical protein
MKAAELLGDRELKRKLDRLSRKGSKKAIEAGVRAGMQPVAKAMRAGINMTSDASPELKREARKTIGARIVKATKKEERQGKVGFKVGKRKAAIGKAVAAREKRIAKGAKGGGVGVSAANVHWFVLGTKKRKLDSPVVAAIGRTKGGDMIIRRVQQTGKVGPVFGDVTRQAVASASGAFFATAKQKTLQVIQKEAKKKA